MTGTLLRAAGPALACLAGALVLDACGSGSAGTSTSTTGANTTTTTVASTSTTASPPTSGATGSPCRAADLSVAYDPAHSSGGAAGSVGLTYRITNTSSQGCTMFGYPGLQLLDAGGRPLPTHVSRVSPYGPPANVTLAPGGQAWFAIQYPTQTGYGNLSCPKSASLGVMAPGDTAQLTVSGPGGQLQPYGGTTQDLQCGHINVTPVAARPPA